jgi:phosphoglycolate phosphatase
MKLFFDLDGTLANPFQAFAGSVHFAFDWFELERPTTDQLKASIGPPLYETFPELLGESCKEYLDELIRAYRAHHEKVGIYQYEFYQGMQQALGTLKGTYPLYVVTSKPTAFTKPIMDHFDHSHFFEEIYGSELDGTRANKAELIAHILEREKMGADEAIMIGDRKHDIIAAKKNGMRSIGVMWGYGSRDELTQAGADRLVGDWQELVQQLS